MAVLSVRKNGKRNGGVGILDAVKKNKRQLQAESTKRQIFEAALRLLEQKEFETITVRDIVREAEVSIGSFYHSYASKLDVFYETYQVADEYFDTEVRRRLTQPTAKARILCFFEEYAFYNCKKTAFPLLKVLYNPNNAYFHRSRNYGMQPMLVELVQQALLSGEFKSTLSAERIAEYLMVCSRGVVYDWCLAAGEYSLTERLMEYVQMLLCAFCK